MLPKVLRDAGCGGVTDARVEILVSSSVPLCMWGRESGHGFLEISLNILFAVCSYQGSVALSDQGLLILRLMFDFL